MNKYCVLAYFLFSCLLSGCTTSHVSTWPATSQFDEVIQRPLTKEIRLVADSQVHESRGTASRFFSLAGDEFVSVTIRTGQQVIGSGDLLRAALANKSAYPLTLHLGDAIDVSCETEWTYFSKVMQSELGKPGPNSWLLAPGNHDGYLVGNFSPLDRWPYKRFHWDNVCNAGRASMTTAGIDSNVHNGIAKDTLIAAYVAMVRGSTGVAPSTGTECLQGGALCFAYRAGPDAWSSYIVQLVRLPVAEGNAPPVYALLLDSSDYPTRPYIWPGDVKAGVNAHISASQTQAARTLLNQLPANARFFIAAHHPYSAWEEGKWSADARAGFDRVIGDPRFMRLLVTAHTHEGGWYEHKLAAKSLYELNLGSLSDAPLYFRSLAFDEDKAGRIHVRSVRTLLGEQPGYDCGTVAAPGPGYRVEDQESASDRLSEFPVVVRTLVGLGRATQHFLMFWEAKHRELRPHLLAYADVVEQTMPAGVPLAVAHRKSFSGREELVSRMRALAACSHATECSVQEKGHILLAVDHYYWEVAPVQVRDAAHRLRYCMALASANEAGNNSAAVADALERSSVTSRVIPAR